MKPEKLKGLGKPKRGYKPLPCPTEDDVCVTFGITYRKMHKSAVSFMRYHDALPKQERMQVYER